MTYVEGFLLAVPTANKEAYLKHANDAWPAFAECGARRIVESWGHDIPDGGVVDLKRAVQAQTDETILFSWFEFASRQARDDHNAKIMAHPSMEQMNQPPFDGSRMVMGGFQSILDTGRAGEMGCVEGFVLAVPRARKDDYLALAKKAADVFLDVGASRVVEAWEDDVPDGKKTDFHRAVLTTADEAVVFAWVEWPSVEFREAALPKLMKDERMKYDPSTLPFDRQRAIFGTFTTILDRSA